METARLTPANAKDLFEQIKDQLGQADRQRMLLILSLPWQNETLALSKLLRSLYPDKSEPDAIALFDQFRSRIQQAADEAGIALELVAELQQNTPPEQRKCWFVGESVEGQQISNLNRLGTRPLDPDAMISPRGTVKNNYRIFVSFAGKDNKLVTSLVRHLEPFLKISKKYRFEIWKYDDNQLLPGEDIGTFENPGIVQEAISSRDLGLLMLSENFFASQYIRDHELPYFTSKKATYGFPLFIHNLDPEKYDFQGLDEKYIFQLEEKSYSESRKKRDWAERLAGAIIDLVKKWETEGRPEATPEEISRILERLSLGEQLLKEDEPERVKRHFVNSRGVTGKLAEIHTQSADKSIDALTYLKNWACDPDSSSYFALLAEYGMGKTWTCMRLTQILETEPDTPNCIYLDLRRLSEVADYRQQWSFSLEEIIEKILRQSLKSAGAPDYPSAVDIIREVRQNGSLIVFDGLDEVIVHLQETHANAFMRTLWDILPPRREEDRCSQRGKVLISCRTHYFRNLQDQTQHFTGLDRENIRADDYQAMTLLPFTWEQIEQYCNRCITGIDFDRFKELIVSIHNIEDLIQRPYNLKLVSDQIEMLEQQRSRGETVNAAKLYHNLVRQWIARDQGKHQINPQHKPLIMEYLAAQLWKRGVRELPYTEIESLFDNWLYERPQIADRYQRDGKSSEVLNEDLRTATFIVRPGAENFRFAHTSIQEYFLARHLYQAIIDDQRELWTMPSVSLETFDFLLQIIQSSEKHNQCSDTISTWLKSYQPQSSEHALAFVLHWLRLNPNQAHGSAFSPPVLATMDMKGAQLAEFRFIGNDEQTMNLSTANFCGADLRGTVFENADLSEAQFVNARLLYSEMQSCRLDHADFTEANLQGSLWRKNRGNRICLQQADLTGGRWIYCHFRKFKYDAAHSDWPLLAKTDAEMGLHNPNRPLDITLNQGHSTSVHACAFSPDGRTLLSAGGDNTLKLWDRETGKCMRTHIHLPNRGHAVLTENSILNTSENAWRYLGWREVDKEKDILRLWPAEIYGPLPGSGGDKT